MPETVGAMELSEAELARTLYTLSGGNWADAQRAAVTIAVLLTAMRTEIRALRALAQEKQP